MARERGEPLDPYVQPDATPAEWESVLAFIDTYAYMKKWKVERSVFPLIVSVCSFLSKYAARTLARIQVRQGQTNHHAFPRTRLPPL